MIASKPLYLSKMEILFQSNGFTLCSSWSFSSASVNSKNLESTSEFPHLIFPLRLGRTFSY